MLLAQKIEVQRKRKAQLKEEYEEYKASELERFHNSDTIIFMVIATFAEWKAFA